MCPMYISVMECKNVGSALKQRIVGVRLDERTFEILKKVVDAQGINISDFVRLSLRKTLAGYGYFDEETTRILSLHEVEPCQ